MHPLLPNGGSGVSVLRDCAHAADEPSPRRVAERRVARSFNYLMVLFTALLFDHYYLIRFTV
jgi:hypothetical protein